MAKPVHSNFWMMEDPYIEPEKRGYTQPDPFQLGTQWNDALFIAGPALVLPDEWRAVDDDADNNEITKELIKVIELDPSQEIWCPSPGYNLIQIIQTSVPGPVKELKGKDISKAWQGQLWSNNPVRAYKVVA
eukprot:2665116-Rhodomonas_salina.1